MATLRLRKTQVSVTSVLAIFDGQTMSGAPADRHLELLGDTASLQIVRLLAEDELTQASIVERLGMNQSLASRAIKGLRGAGLVTSDTARGPLRLRAPDESRALLLAGDRLAEAVLRLDEDDQRTLSTRTRKAAMRPTPATRVGRGPGDA